MTKTKIIFSDNLHFHERNFKSLFEYIHSNKIEHAFMNPNKPMLSAFGNYYQFNDIIASHRYLVEGLDCIQLMDFSYRGIPIFSTCKAELLAYLLPRFNWRNNEIFNIDKEIIEKAFSQNYEDLINNMAATIYWIDFWHEELDRYKIHDFCCVFSGTSIYSNTLLQILKTHVTTPLVLESFFTGNDYYLERKYESLPNNSDLKFKTVFESYEIPNDCYEYNKLKNKAINKIISANNKNVKQPEVDIEDTYASLSNYILIGGQVLNDYSTITTQYQLNSIKTYISVIQTLLKYTDFDVVFKAHPWEEKKNNIRSPLTYNEIKKFKANLSQENQSRLHLLNHSNLNSLIKNASGFITICSQSALEAAHSGLKPIVIGSAFFDGYGFTSNYKTTNDFDFAQRNKSVSYVMSLNDYLAYERFIIVSLCMHLVSVHKSGSIRLSEILGKTHFVKTLGANAEKSIIENNISENNEINFTKDTDIVEQVSNAVKLELKDNNRGLDGKIINLDSKIEKIISDLNKANTNSISLNSNNSIKVLPRKDKGVKSKVIKIEDSIVKIIGTNRLYQKYSKHRKVFFEDVKNPVVIAYWKKIGKKLDFR
ncbi:MAG: capsular biosynthesis protein [Psychrobacter sp.]